MTDSAKANDLLAQLPKGKGPAPVHLWNPDFCGHIDMRIARDGTWFYQGTPIGRKPMVKLFSTIIRRDGDDYFLITRWKKSVSPSMMRPLSRLPSTSKGRAKARCCVSPPTSTSRLQPILSIHCGW